MRERARNQASSNASSLSNRFVSLIKEMVAVKILVLMSSFNVLTPNKRQWVTLSLDKVLKLGIILETLSYRVKRCSEKLSQTVR